jgi:hypothetical protein
MTPIHIASYIYNSNVLNILEACRFVIVLYVSVTNWMAALLSIILKRMLKTSLEAAVQILF